MSGPVSGRRAARSVATLLTATAAVIVLGAVAGAIWALVTPPTTGVVVKGLTREDIPTGFDGVGAFALIMFAYGGIAALVAWAAARPWRGVTGFLVPALGTVAGSAIGAQVGMWLAGLRFDDDIAGLPLDSVYRVVPELWLDGGTRAGHSAPWTLLICAPFAFAMVYLVCALSSRTADLGVGDLDVDHRAGDDPSGSEVTSVDAVSRTHP
ncbi:MULTISPECIES: DUF2567 domain-containing protein [Gordonia]|uniref:DUF2567 domain-containing protein n=1 Tax=Gordonia TaxID=2053 RepID=UPI0002A64892|nr:MULTISPECIES: DUF2567 domain-containing protein [Gordonia]GAC55487.1 hypothetical protein GOAMI_54_00250 [Gordonia amicalis NBRC 100051 = JCM 11271]MBA5849609.1 DUF2567 domain-containing protein [Gordonia amicalis]MDJ0452171.1 DUF2567 domain-containing protein [Gordonia amicalis]MDV7074784.1 DUF2567 domain-containing protein [Gordonia amicalis]MDV7098919.1 DUF2567 domain-containing protein [Gordonia amicalis]